MRLVRPIAIAVFFLPVAAQGQTTVAGATPGSFRVTESGAAEYRIPIRVPPGVGGMEPRLALVYNSQAGNGLLGVGWNLEGLSAISRCPMTMAQDGVRGGVNYDLNDRFCLDGQRLMAISGTYGADGTEYRTERESFTKVISYGTAGNGPAWFKAWTKSGQIMEYGNTADSRIEAQGKPSVRVWAMNKVSDTKGNYLTVSYAEDAVNGGYRPSRVDYAGGSARFSYQARPDMESAYEAGSLVKELERLDRIETYAGNTVVTVYRLTYDNAGVNGRSRITEVAECADAGECLPATTLAYPASAVPALTAFGAVSGWSPSGGFTSANVYPMLSGDWNGDGKADWGRVRGGGITFFISQGDGFTQHADFPGWGPSNGFSDGNVYPVFTGDWNGDGVTDWARVHYGGIRFFVGAGGGFVQYADVAGWGYGGGFVDGNVYPIITGDWNGDGRTDWARVHSTGITFFVSTGSGFAQHVDFPGWSPGNGGFTDASTYPIFTGDWNGDGLTDWARVHYGGIRFFIGDGNGFVQYADVTGWGYGGGFVDGNVYPIITGDWNADGKTDWARVYSTGTTFFVSTGSGFAQHVNFPGWSPGNGGFTNSSVYPIFTGDWNGDGKTDWGRVHCCGATFFASTGAGFAQFAQIPNIGPNQGGFTDGNVYPVSTGDWNGDGKTDFSRVQYAGMGFYKGGFFVPDSPATISPGTGAPVSVTYKPLTDALVYAKDAGPAAAAYPDMDLQVPLYVVASASSGNGIGGSIASQHRYGGLKARADGRGTLGFRWLERTDQSTGLKMRSEHRQDWPYSGLPSLVTKTLASGGMLSAATSTYGCLDPATGSPCATVPGNRYFPFVAQTTETGNDLDGAALPAVTTSTQYDSFGNATQVSVSTGDGYSKITGNVYTNDVPSWLLGRLKSSTVESTVP